MTIPVNVYAESTPNPAAMKFVCDLLLLEEGVVEFTNINEAVSCPMAQQLFAFSGVKSVFITSNFVTVTKESDIEWFEITNIIREFIRGYLMSGEKLFVSNPFKKETDAASEKLEKTPAVSIPVEGQVELEEQIIQMLDEYVKPAVEQDGGAIHFRSFSNGVVTVALKGSCSGCPSSTLTLKSGIENLLKSMLPQVTEVVAEAE